MKKIKKFAFISLLTITLLCLNLNTTLANSNSVKNFKLTQNFSSSLKETKNIFTGVIVEYNQIISFDDTIKFEMRFTLQDKSTTEWITVDPNHDFKHSYLDKPITKVDSLVNTNPAKFYEYRVTFNAGTDAIRPSMQNLKLTFINPKEGVSELLEQELDNNQKIQVASSNATKSNLKIISRKSWGANDSYNYITDEAILSSSDSEDKSNISNKDPEISKIITKEKNNLLKWPYQYAKDIKMIVVHHTASTNNLDDPKQAIRNIQYYHAVKRGWGDIGYNYIIDQKGNIYEGRKGGEAVIGGHSLPVNKASIGISVLGNFETQKVPKSVATAIAELTAEKADLYNLDVKKKVKYNGVSYPVFGGHKDNSKTACPGLNLYNSLGSIKTLVAKSGSKSSVVKDQKNLNINPTENYAFTDLDPFREVVDINGGETKKIEVKLQNTGKQTWNKDSTYLAFYDSTEYQKALQFKTDNQNSAFVGFLKEKSVATGKTGTFEIEVTGKHDSGLQTVLVRAVLNSVIKSKSPIAIPIYLNESEYSFEISGKKSAFIKMKPNETTSVSFKIKNTSNFAWNKTNKVLLGIVNPKDTKSKLLAGRPKARVGEISNTTIEPNKTVTVTLDIKAPSEPGFYIESYAPVIDGVAWFDKNTPFALNIEVEGQTTKTSNNFVSNQITTPTTQRAIVSSSNLKNNVSQTNTVSLTSTQNNNTTLKSNNQIKVDNLELGPIIRIHISNFAQDSANITTTHDASIAINGRVRGTVKKGTVVTVIKGTNGNNTVKFDSNSFSGHTIQILSLESNINTISNFENRPAWNNKLNDNMFRGNLEFRNFDDKLYLINELYLEHYMRGLAEISNGDNAEKIKTIITAGRSYAYFYLTEGKGKKFKGMPYDLDDSPDRTQKYLGYGYELRSPNVTKAVTLTKGQVLQYNKKSVVIPYFNQSDGKTRSANEVWGWTDAPYLVSVKDSYCKPGNKLLGHGVGISGCGATGMAESGFKYDAILKYYLKGIELNTVY